MGSVGNQNPWQTYDTFKDCSQGICSIYCPQWCYIIFPPPPPFLLPDDDNDDSSNTDFSPLIIAVIGILASAFILVSYYTIISKYCRRRHGGDGGQNGMEWDQHHPQTNESWQGTNTSGGLDESFIKSITVCKYKKGDGFVDGTDCSVCLTEFQENESLRLLPKCSHAFHLPCIDTWLKSHPSCPLCRANIASSVNNNIQPPPENQETPPTTTTSTTISAQEYQHRSNDSVVVIQDLERSVEEEAVAVVVDGEEDEELTKGEVQDAEIGENNVNNNNNNGIQAMRRSISLNSSVCQNQMMIMMSISDILSINYEEEDDDENGMRDRDNNKIGIMNLITSPLAIAMKRSVSTGRCENAMNSIIP